MAWRHCNKSRKGKIPLAGKKSVLLAVLLLSSCIKDNLLEFLDIFPYTLFASADFEHRGKDAIEPDAYIMYHEYNTYALPTDSICRVEIMATRGTTALYAFNAADSVYMEDTEAWVKRIAGDTIYHLPAYFFSNFQYINPRQAESDSVHFTMEQQMRRLDIEIGLDVPERQHITRGEGTLQGVYAMFDISSLEYAQDTFYVRFPLRYQDNSLVSELHLFGINPSISQHLALTIYLEDGSSVDVEDDLSDELKPFNDEKTIPFKLSTRLDLHYEAGFSATLEDWVAEDEEFIDVQ